jgi:hypothetical protein
MPTRHYAATLAILLLTGILTGCASSGAFNTATVTNVELSESNYEVVATNVQGEASAGYLLGLSLSASRQVRTLALARVSGSEQLYGDALEQLWTQFEAQHGDAEGRNLALTNVRYDTSSLNLILYTQPTLTVRADVVEFTD